MGTGQLRVEVAVQVAVELQDEEAVVGTAEGVVDLRYEEAVEVAVLSAVNVRDERYAELGAIEGVVRGEVELLAHRAVLATVEGDIHGS